MATEIDLTEFSEDQLRAAYNTKVAQRTAVVRSEAEKREAEAKRLAEIGREEALEKASDLIQQVENAIAEIERLSCKHHLNLSIEFDGGSYGLSFSRWGIDGSGWEGSNC